MSLNRSSEPFRVGWGEMSLKVRMRVERGDKLLIEGISVHEIKYKFLEIEQIK